MIGSDWKPRSKQRMVAARFGRTLAGYRTLMIVLFGLLLWINPNTFIRGGRVSIAFYFTYLACSLILLAVSFRSWWLSFKLYVPAFLLDFVALAVALLATQAFDFDFISPFFVFFVFLFAVAHFRWGQKAAPFVGAVIAFVFLSTALMLDRSGAGVDVPRALRRFAYLVLLSLLLAKWMRDRGDLRIPRFERGRHSDGALAIQLALDYAMNVAGASGAALTWALHEEPNLRVEVRGSLGTGSRRLPVRMEADPPQHLASLVDTRRGREISFGRDGELTASNAAEFPQILASVTVVEGLVVPISGSAGSGQLVLTGIAGLAWEDLYLAAEIGTEVAIGLDEEAGASALRDRASLRIRGDLARDLHDSVVQSLAGYKFQLEALRNDQARGADLAPQLDRLRDSLAAEEAQLRAVIGRLRQPDLSAGRRNIGVELKDVAAALAEHWKLPVGFTGSGSGIEVRSALAHELVQIAREGVANAVRHGGATQIDIALAGGEAGEIEMVIADNGMGFPELSEMDAPRTISERVAALAGSLHVLSSPGSTSLRIRIPAKDCQ